MFLVELETKHADLITDHYILAVITNFIALISKCTEFRY